MANMFKLDENQQEIIWSFYDSIHPYCKKELLFTMFIHSLREEKLNKKNCVEVINKFLNVIPADEFEYEFEDE